MANRIIELHDSRITGIRIDGDQVVLEIDAYVHESDGAPGIDPGVGLGQRIELVFERARVVERPNGSQLWIIDGRLTSRAHSIDNLLPIAFECPEPLEFEASGGEGRLRIVAERAHLIVIGEPRLIEEFEGV